MGLMDGSEGRPGAGWLAGGLAVNWADCRTDGREGVDEEASELEGGRDHLGTGKRAIRLKESGRAGRRTDGRTNK